MEPDRYDDDNKSEIVTIMLADIAGYTKKTANLPRNSLEKLQDIFDTISIPLFQKYSGRVIKKMGDAFMVTFRSATDSLLCAIELQKAFGYYNKGQPPKNQLHIRIVLHTGEVIFRQGDIYGDTVNTTARVESIAKADHIVFTGSTYLAMNRIEVPYIHLGQKTLKGIKNPVRLFRVKDPYEQVPKPKIVIKRRKQSNAGVILIIVLIMVIVAFTFLMLYPEVLSVFFG